MFSFCTAMAELSSFNRKLAHKAKNIHNSLFECFEDVKRKNSKIPKLQKCKVWVNIPNISKRNDKAPMSILI